MADHRDWYIPIAFIDEVWYVAYGRPGWCSRSVWMVPGTFDWEGNPV